MLSAEYEVERPLRGSAEKATAVARELLLLADFRLDGMTGPRLVARRPPRRERSPFGAGTLPGIDPIELSIHASSVHLRATLPAVRDLRRMAFVGPPLATAALVGLAWLLATVSHRPLRHPVELLCVVLLAMPITSLGFLGLAATTRRQAIGALESLLHAMGAPDPAGWRPPPRGGVVIEVTRPRLGSIGAAIEEARSALVHAGCRVVEIGDRHLVATGLPAAARQLNFLTWAHEIRVDVDQATVRVRARVGGLRWARAILVAASAPALLIVALDHERYAATDEGLGAWIAMVVGFFAFMAFFTWLAFVRTPKVFFAGLAERAAEGDAPLILPRTHVVLDVVLPLVMFLFCPLAVGFALGSLVWEIMAKRGAPLTAEAKAWLVGGLAAVACAVIALAMRRGKIGV